MTTKDAEDFIEEFGLENAIRMFENKQDLLAKGRYTSSYMQDFAYSELTDLLVLRQAIAKHYEQINKNQVFDVSDMD